MEQPAKPLPGSALHENILYTYAVAGMLPKDKILFFYATRGRNGKEGIFSRLKIKQIGPCVLMVPKAAEKELDAFLKKWKCPFKKEHVMVPG